MDLGVENLVCTRGIMALWSEDVDFAVFCIDSIHKHLEMVYGDEKGQLNRDNLFSSFEFEPNYTKIWIITEVDGSVTTVLLPEEY